MGMTDAAFFVRKRSDRFSDLWGRSPKICSLIGPLALRLSIRRTRCPEGGHGLIGTMDDFARFSVAKAARSTACDPEARAVRMIRDDFLPISKFIWHNGTS